MAMLPWWIHYPYVNNEIQNLDWLLQVSNENTDKIENFISVNIIKYADPILWDITSQYEANTIVVDPQTGDAYISTKAVPYGVALSNEGYWTKIYNYAYEIHIFREQIAADEQLSTTATAPRSVDDLVFLNGLLYRVTAPMIAGDSYVEDSNCVKTTINAELLRLHTSIGAETQAREDADEALGQRIDDEVQAREDADIALGHRIDDEVQAREDADIALGQRIDNLDVNHVYNEAAPDSGLTSNIGLKEGTYDIDSDLTINAQLVVPKGAVLNIASGVTLTINGQILAGRYQIFSGDGNVVVNSELQPFGYPEWFGVTVNDSTFDCSVAINKTLAVFGYCKLSSAIYYVSNTITVDANNMILEGVKRTGITNNAGTIIKDTRLNSTTVLVGNDATAIASYVCGVKINNITIDRVDGTLSLTNGLYVKHCLDCWFEHIVVKRSSRCYLIYQNVDVHFNYCDAIQYFTNIDRYGFLASGTPQQVVGSNGSLYLVDCHCTGTLSTTNINIGFGCDGAPADTFIDGFETSGYASGIVIFDASDTENSSNDIHIEKAIIDGISEHGIYFNGLSTFGSVTVQNCYVAPASGYDSAYSYRASNCSCPISFIGNQAVHNVASNMAVSFFFDGSSLISTTGNVIVQSYRPYVLISCSSIKMNDVIKMTNTSTHPICDVGTSANAIVIEPTASGATGAYSYIFSGVSASAKVLIIVSSTSDTIMSNAIAYNGSAGINTTTGSYTIINVGS